MNSLQFVAEVTFTNNHKFAFFLFFVFLFSISHYLTAARSLVVANFTSNISLENLLNTVVVMHLA